MNPLLNPPLSRLSCFRKASPLAWGISVLLFSNVVFAQEEESKSNIEEVQVLGKYIVNEQLDTATGLGLTLQETPQSVSIMTFQRIEDQGLKSLTDVVNNAAGISSKAYDSSRNAFSSRGFDVDNYQIDGIPVQWEGGSSAGETQTDMALYERVEIVRGATGLLTGAGHPSASINLVRKHADSEVFKGYASLSASRWNNYNATLDLSSPLNQSGSVRGRTVVVYEDGDSFVDYAGNQKSVFYAVMDADLTDNTLISVGASYQDNDPTASQWGGLPIFFSDGTRTDWDRSKTVGAQWTAWATSHETYFFNLTHEFGNNWQLRANVNRTQSNSEMKLLYLFGSPDPETGLGMGPSPARYDNERTQDDYGFRLTGLYSLFNREHELVLGMQHSEQDFVYNSYSATNTAEVGNFFEWDGSFPEPTWGDVSPFQKQTTEQTGYYAATRITISDPFKIVVGTRLSDWKRVDHLADDEYGDDGVMIPYAGALYDVTDDHTLYVSYTEIFQPQSAQDINRNFLDPIVGSNRELGIKSKFFDDALHTTVTFFWTEEDNLAVEDRNFEPDPEDPSFQAYIEADGVSSDGFELEMVGQITNNWQVSANYTQFEATAEDIEGEANTVNTRFPRKIFRLFTTYQQQDLTVGGGVSWEGENYTDVANPSNGASERVSQEAYALVNLMARYQFNDQLSSQINIDNVFDETYYSQIGFYTQLAYGKPRDITLSVKYQF
ncbi:Ferripyoverdine receptor [Thalassocella blandensis]|nr:Ferripyoverdine receptor [Thalassocella blandensis]